MVKYGQSDGNPNNDKNLKFKSIINKNLSNRKPSLLFSKNVLKNVSSWLSSDFADGLSTNQRLGPRHQSEYRFRSTQTN